MYFWNIRALANELGKNKVSEKTGMHYFLVSTLLVLFATYYAMWWGAERSWQFYFEFIVLGVITVFGCLKSFEANGGEEGHSFVQRGICLSVPAGIRVNIFGIVFGLLMYFNADDIFPPTLFSDPYRTYLIVGYAGFVGFNVYFWWLLIKGFKYVRKYES